MPKSLKVIKRNFIVHVVCVLTLVLTISFRPLFAQEVISEVVQVDSTSALELKNRVNIFLTSTLRANSQIITNTVEEGTAIKSYFVTRCFLGNTWIFHFNLLINYKDNKAKITFTEDYYHVDTYNKNDFSSIMTICKDKYLNERTNFLTNLKKTLLTKTKRDDW